MSKIVILTGSKRKGGNTELLARAFADGAGEHHEVEIIPAADYKVNPCIGCNSCFTREGNQCFQEDDMQLIYEKLTDAEILVIASPVYFYGISAQLKAVVDRLHKIKKMVLLLVAGAALPSVFDAIKVQYQLILDFFKLENAGMVLVREVREKGEIKGNPALEEARELGRSL